MAEQEPQSIPVALARATVQASGELEGVEGPHFMAEAGAEWAPFFSVALYGQGAHPEFARVIVTRKGQKPREVVISWAEYADQMDADPEWDAIRASKPMAVFGGECERHAYRVVFADILAPLLEARPAPAAPSRDWLADVAAAKTGEDVKRIFVEAREAQAITGELQAALTKRLAELSAVKPVEVPSPYCADHPEGTDLPCRACGRMRAEALASVERATPTPAQVAARSKPLSAQTPPSRNRKRRNTRDRQGAA